ncbi:MAG: ABC-2 family transporter protein [Lachnospiraceae bacterium]|nr:ABC-2 family transporter protein [Lachnospiraceae bacterium]
MKRMLAPYLAFAKKSFLNKSAYRFDHFMGILNTLLKIFIFWCIYRTLYGARTEVDGITMAMVTTNFVLSIGLDALFSVNDYYLPDRIGNGSIATELLLPVSFQGRMLFENLGNTLFKLFFHFLPAVVVSALTVGILPPAGVGSFMMFVVSALFGYGVLWSVSYLLQMFSFWLINMWSLITIKNVFINVLSGSMIPLWFMPDWMAPVLKVLPFSSIYFTPVQIYLGQLTSQEILGKCLIQLGWIAVLYLCGNFLWEKGKKKLVVQGG